MDHILERHEFGSLPRASKFLEGEDILSLIREGVNKNSISEYSSQGNFVKEVDMGRSIGNYNNKETTVLRIIFDSKGDVLTSYPEKPIF